MTEQKTPPREAELWAGPMGERWLANHTRFEGMIAPAGDALLAAAQFQPGETVIDIGCGAGALTLEIARRVAPGGSVTGLDISPPLIGACKSRAEAAGITNARFVLGDASAADLDGARFDRLVSRFGVMFFDDPYGAFHHMRGFLKPRGLLTFLCWGPIADNPWYGAITAVARRYSEAPPVAPRAPGPFAFEEAAYVREILSEAGFVGLDLDLWRGEQLVGGEGAGVAEAADLVLDGFGVGEALKDRPDAVRAEARADLMAAFTPFNGPNGVRAPAAAWVVQGRA